MPSYKYYAIASVHPLQPLCVCVRARVAKRLTEIVPISVLHIIIIIKIKSKVMNAIEWPVLARRIVVLVDSF